MIIERAPEAVDGVGRRSRAGGEYAADIHLCAQGCHGAGDRIGWRLRHSDPYIAEMILTHARASKS